MRNILKAISALGKHQTRPISPVLDYGSHFPTKAIKKDVWRSTTFTYEIMKEFLCPSIDFTPAIISSYSTVPKKRRSLESTWETGAVLKTSF